MPANAQLLAPKPRPEATHSVSGEAGRDHHIISECCHLKAPLPSASAHFKQDEVRASPAANPLPGILREQDRPPPNCGGTLKFCYAGLPCLQREVPTTQWKIPTTIVHSGVPIAGGQLWNAFHNRPIAIATRQSAHVECKALWLRDAELLAFPISRQRSINQIPIFLKWPGACKRIWSSHFLGMLVSEWLTCRTQTH